MFDFYEIDNCKVLLNATPYKSWDMEVYGRVFHISQDDEIRLLERFITDEGIYTLNEIRSLNYSGKEIGNVNAFSFMLTFLQQHKCAHLGQAIDGLQAYIALGGNPNIVSRGAILTRRERLFHFMCYSFMAGVCGTLFAYLMGKDVSWIAICLFFVLAIGCARMAYNSISNTLRAYATQIMLATICVVIGCLGRNGSSNDFIIDMVGTLANIGAVFATGCGTVIFALMSWHNCIEFFNKENWNG